MKKFISVLLALIMVLSVTTVGFSAYNVVDAGVPDVADKLADYDGSMQKIYFMMPNGENGDVGSDGSRVASWYNEYNLAADGKHYAGAYTWIGPAACDAWPGYKMEIDDYDESVYSIEFPGDGETSFVIFNNGVDSSIDPDNPLYYCAAQSIDINCEGALEGDYDSLPAGTVNEYDFDGYIYVLDPDQVSVNQYSQKQTCGGNWYAYYGNGCYGNYAESQDGFVSVDDNCLNPNHWVDGVHVGSHSDEPTDKAVVTVYGLDGKSETREFNVGDTFTVYTTLNSSAIDDGRISSIDAEQSYTDSVLALADEYDPDEGDIFDIDTVFPITGDYTVTNAGESGYIYYNASKASMARPFIFNSNESELIVTTYTVTAPGTAEIRNKFVTLAMADYSLTKIVDKSEIIIPDFRLHASFTVPSQQPTEAPEEPTEAPEYPTEAPEEPTEAPEEPTEAPEYLCSFLLTDNFGWGYAYVYAWDDNGDDLYGEWPGAAMAETVTNEYGETQFLCYVPKGAAGVILNNGSGAQTEDITDFAYEGYWMDGSKNEIGQYLVFGWGHQDIDEPTEAPEEPTEAPEEPTEAPEEPTEAPEEPTEAPEYPTEAPATYYLVGNMNDWMLNDDYMLTPNEEAYGEYSIYVYLTTEDQFKIVSGNYSDWYPEGMDNNYGQNGEIPADGYYTVYFRPDCDGSEDWFYNCIYVASDEPEYPTEEPEYPTEAYDKAIVTVYGLDGESETREFNVGDTFTVYTTLNTSAYDNGAVSALNATQTYTNTVLTLANEYDSYQGEIIDLEEMFPITRNHAVARNAWRASEDDPTVGAIYFNASTTTNIPFYFDDDSDILIKSDYTVTAPGEAEVGTTMVTLACADEVLTRIINDSEIILPDFRLHASFEAPAEAPTDAPYVEPTEGPAEQASFLLTDNFGWGTAYVYAWDADGNPLLGQWPGAAQAETVINEYGETMFLCHVPAGAYGVILNNGAGEQTEDITDFSYDGYWMDGSRNDYGHFIVTGWNESDPEQPSTEAPTEAPTQAPTMAPGETKLYFDTNGTGWTMDSRDKVAFYIFGGDLDGELVPWGGKRALGVAVEGLEGVFEYDPVAKAGVSFTPGVQYQVIFVHIAGNNWREQTYELYFTTDCFGHVAYCDGTMYENPVDACKTALAAYWDDIDPAVNGPVLAITSMGNVIGTCAGAGRTNLDIFTEFCTEVIDYDNCTGLENARRYVVELQYKTEQQLIDDIGTDLGLTKQEVYDVLIVGRIATTWDYTVSTLPGDVIPVEIPTDEPTEPPTEAPVDNSGYYLVGNMTDWQIDSSLKLEPVDESFEEFYIDFDLYTDKQFKIVYSEDGETIYDYDWFPGGMGNNYGENGEITEDGAYTIHFRPNYDAYGWFYECIYAELVESFNDPDDIRYSGSFGDLDWTLTYGGKLTFSGSGEIPESAFQGYYEIKEVIINDSVTGIGAYAFDGLNCDIYFTNRDHIFSEDEFRYLNSDSLVTLPTNCIYRVITEDRYEIQLNDTLSGEELDYAQSDIDQAQYELDTMLSWNYPTDVAINAINSARNRSVQYYKAVFMPSETIDTVITYENADIVFGSAMVELYVPCYSVTWKNYDGSVIYIDDTVEEGSVPTYDGETPTKPSDAQYNYEFSGWEPELEPTTGAVEYTATFTPVLRSYTVTWENWDGEVLDTTDADYGTLPVYSGEEPTKDADAQYSYSFIGWYPIVSAVTGDVTYTAQFDAVVNEYEITWKNDDGSIIDVTSVAYGTVPTHADAEKAADAQYTYIFDAWTPEIVEVTGDAEYTATYTAELNEYEITWKNDDGSIIDVTTVPYGELPAHDDAEKAADAQYTYTFDKWTPEIVEVTGDAEYTATYTATTNKYDVIWKDAEGKTIGQDSVEYGVVPEFTGEIPVIPDDTAYTYTFAGWTPEVTAVSGDAEYTATYAREFKKGLILLDGDFYYVLYNGEFKKNDVRTVTEEFSNGLLPAGEYYFDEDGKMINVPLKNGIDEEGYYRVNYFVQKNAGLIEYEDGFIYVQSSGKVKMDGYQNVTAENNHTDLPDTIYYFDADGKLVMPIENGVDDGKYFRLNYVVQLDAGLIEYEGDYYYVLASGKVLTDNFQTVTDDRNNSDMPSTLYFFGADGKMEIPAEYGVDAYTYFRMGYVVQKDAGLIDYNGDYYYVLPSGKVKVDGDRVVTAEYNKTELPNGTYTFGPDGKMINVPLENGIDADGYYRVDYVIQKDAGLISFEGDYYYVLSSGKVKKNDFQTVTNEYNHSDMPSTIYFFGADGKMDVPAPNGVDAYGYFRLDYAVQLDAGLVEYDGDFYYVLTSGKVKVGSRTVTADKSNGLLPAGTYTFGEDGKMIDVPLQNGIDADFYYRVNYMIQTVEGLIEYEGDFYYVLPSGKVKVNGDRTVTAEYNHTYLPDGTYSFGPDGKMTDVPQIIIITIDEECYYRENGEIVKDKGLVEYNGDFYYVLYNGKVKKGDVRTVTADKSNGLLPAGDYHFDADGKMIDVPLKNGIDADGYYRVDYFLLKDYGLIEIDGDIYCILPSGKIKKNGSRVITEAKTNGLMPAGTYYFDADGKLILN